MSDTPTYRLTLAPVDPARAESPARELLATARKQNGMVPNMYANMANMPALLATYMDGYERFRKEGGFTPAEQEVVFLTLSYENGCEYCMAAHSLLADTRSRVPLEVTEAIRQGAPVPDAKLAALSTFTQVMLNSRGRPSPEEVQAFLAAGYSEQQVLAIILALGVKTLSNYANHLFDTPVDGVFKVREWKAFQATNKVLRFLRRGA